MKTIHSVDNQERVVLLGVDVKKTARGPGASMGDAGRESLAELEELARSAGGTVVASILQMRDALDPATLVGRGKLEEVKIEAQMRDAPLIIVDRNLSPVQLRNMERITDCRVIDRTQLILDIFARRARTREGKLQVELAQLNYLLPRLTGRGAEMSRLGGRSGGGGGGRIGTRGPGEQKLETDRRRIRIRVSKLKEAIETVRRQRSTRREARRSAPLGTVALVGYTNAGKSTLFNALTSADVLVSARMFATLDPTVRALALPSHRKVLLSDTVGFLRDLPPGLIAAFRATLEELDEAGLILHVTDISNPNHAEQDTEVEKILADLGLADRPRLHVFNKIDRLPAAELEALRRAQNAREEKNKRCVFVSALTGEAFQELRERIDAGTPVDPLVQLSLRLELSDGRNLALVYECGRVLRSQVVDGHIAIEAELPQSLAWRLAEFTQQSPA
jgi:GTPase